MTFTKKDIEKLADLARIELSEKEKKSFCEQISSILDYVKQIEEVDASTAKIREAHTRSKNVLRVDDVAQYSAVKKIIGQFPEKYGNLNKVKKVFE